jgi:hypothetical protein
LPLLVWSKCIISHGFSILGRLPLSLNMVYLIEEAVHGSLVATHRHLRSIAYNSEYFTFTYLVIFLLPNIVVSVRNRLVVFHRGQMPHIYTYIDVQKYRKPLTGKFTYMLRHVSMI